MSDRQSDLGHVWLVGAGPGDPGLITVAGLTALRRAEIILHDRLSSPDLLREARADALLIDAGKAPGDQHMTQDEINKALVDYGRSGRTVVRLKGGDPYVFGRGGEEALTLASAGVPCTVIPGITSAIGGLGAGGIPITQRGVATSFTVVTGHEDPTKPESQVRWAALAGAAETLVVLMGVERLERIAGAILAAGRAPSTPAALVQDATAAHQRVVTGTLETIVAAARREQVKNPAVFVVGEVAGLQPMLAREALAPLAGRRVLVVGSDAERAELATALRLEAAQPIEVSMGEHFEHVDQAAVNAAHHRLKGGAYRWIVFTSAGAVDLYMAALLVDNDLRTLGRVAICAIDADTQRSLRAHGLRADLVPPEPTAEALRVALAAAGIAGAGLLLPHAEPIASDVLVALTATGAEVDELSLWIESPEGEPTVEGPRMLPGEQIDVLLVAPSSTSTLRQLVRLTTGEPSLQDIGTVACMSPTTAETARGLGLRVDVVATEHTTDGLIRALRSHVAGSRDRLVP